MAKYLRIEPGGDRTLGGAVGANYHLPEDADIEQIIEQVGQAIAQGTSLIVPLDFVYGRRASSAYVVINGSLVTHVTVWEIPEPAGAQPGNSLAPPGPPGPV
jgi:hypothetical protein